MSQIAVFDFIWLLICNIFEICKIYFVSDVIEVLNNANADTHVFGDRYNYLLGSFSFRLASIDYNLLALYPST